LGAIGRNGHLAASQRNWHIYPCYARLASWSTVTRRSGSTDLHRRESIPPPGAAPRKPASSEQSAVRRHL